MVQERRFQVALQAKIKTAQKILIAQVHPAWLGFDPFVGQIQRKKSRLPQVTRQWPTFSNRTLQGKRSPLEKSQSRLYDQHQDQPQSQSSRCLLNNRLLFQETLIKEILQGKVLPQRRRRKSTHFLKRTPPRSKNAKPRKKQLKPKSMSHY